MKRIALGLSLLVLTACGSSQRGVACQKEYWDGTIGLCVPSGWVIIDRETLNQRGAPDDTLVAFQKEEAVAGQFPTVTVTKEPLITETSPEAYSEASIRSVSVLPGYTFIDSSKTRIDEAEVDIHIFTAQPITDEPKRRFYQVSTFVEKVGYTVTAATPVSIDDTLEQEVMLILQSTTFVSPDEEEAEE